MCICIEEGQPRLAAELYPTTASSMPADSLHACMQALEQQRQETLAAVSTAAAGCLSRRQPLVRAAATKQPEVKLFNPRFEEDYAAGKEYDPDRHAVFPTLSLLTLQVVLLCSHVGYQQHVDPCTTRPGHKHAPGGRSARERQHAFYQRQLQNTFRPNGCAASNEPCA